MYTIGSHNSGTGERSLWWRAAFIPFARCQRKTMLEQYTSGVRYFDLRLRKRGSAWVFAHGLWESESCADDILRRLNVQALVDGEQLHARVLYEGGEGKVDDADLISYVDFLRLILTNIDIEYIRNKKSWRLIKLYSKSSPMADKYHILTRAHGWRFLLPIPFLWWLLRSKELKTPTDCVVNFYDFI